MPKKSVAIIPVIFLILFCCMACMKNNGNSTSSKNGGGEKNNQELKPTMVTNAAITGNSYQIGDAVTCQFSGSVTEYTVNKVEFYDDINTPSLARDQFEESSRKLIHDDGSIDDSCRLLLLDITAKAIQSPSADSVMGENQHNISELALRKGNQEVIDAGFFSLNETTDITRSSKDGEYYHYSLPKDKTVTVRLGFLVPKQIINNSLYLSVGADLTKCKYILLTK